ncbi:MAG: type II toxin-antitoxin system VapC family toxin [Conexivisphaera sp.]
MEEAIEDEVGDMLVAEVLERMLRDEGVEPPMQISPVRPRTTTDAGEYVRELEGFSDLTVVYMDSSVVVKRYVLESGSDVVSEIYGDALDGELSLSFSLWNVGEVLGVLDKYYRRGQLTEQDYGSARLQFMGEVLRLLRLRVLKIVPIRVRVLVQTWSLVEKYHIHEADALQVASAKAVNATKLCTADEELYEVAVREGMKGCRA